LITRRRLSGFPFSVSTAVGVPPRLPCDNFDGKSKCSGQKVEAAHSALLGIHHSALGPDGRPPKLRMSLASPTSLVADSVKDHRPDEARLAGERLGTNIGQRSWNLSAAL
jgi:hypothetical protein